MLISYKSPWNLSPTLIVYKTFKIGQKIASSNTDLMKLLLPENFLPRGEYEHINKYRMKHF